VSHAGRGVRKRARAAAATSPAPNTAQLVLDLRRASGQLGLRRFHSLTDDAPHDAG